jgi:hypothetical protein
MGECMIHKAPFVYLILYLLIVVGCSEKARMACKPVLFPYPEYRYKAEPVLLNRDSSIRTSGEIIKFSGLKISVPNNWSYERLFNGKTIRFSKSKDHFFFISFKHSEQWPHYFDYKQDLGCDWSEFKSNAPLKNEKDFYSDLYLFTDNELSSAPESLPWQYLVLWEKTQLLDDARRLIYYEGDKVQAFQKNKDPYIHPDSGVETTIVIFYERITSDYFSLGSTFTDDSFFYNFLSMLNTLNT